MGRAASGVRAAYPAAGSGDRGRRKLSSRLRVRLAGETDAATLATFECSTGAWFEDEVEDHVRHHAVRRFLAEPTSYRLLVCEDDDGIWAVGAHMPEYLLLVSGGRIEATRLTVLALVLRCQGGATRDGTRYSDTAMEWLLRDALTFRRNPVVTAIVARENHRSLRVCRRHGLDRESILDARYARMLGHFAVARRSG